MGDMKKISSKKEIPEKGEMLSEYDFSGALEATLQGIS